MVKHFHHYLNQSKQTALELVSAGFHAGRVSASVGHRVEYHYCCSYYCFICKSSTVYRLP